jgi:hypothetical protein
MEKVMTEGSGEKDELKPGDRMPDGTVYAGTSPKTGRPMYAAAVDEFLTMIFSEAMKTAGQSRAHGHHDWRVPAKEELNVLQQDKDKGALKGTFNETGPTIAGWYWSSSQFDDLHAWGQRFSDGGRGWNSGSYRSSVRLVRG